MRCSYVIVVILLTVLVFFLGVFLPRRAADLEVDVYYSVYAFGEGSLFNIAEQRAKEKDITDREESEVKPLLTSFSGCGVYSRTFGEEECFECEEIMRELGFETKEEVLSLLSEKPLASLSAPLVAEELGSLFFLLVAFSEEEAPVKGGLRMIAFEKSEDSFLLFAEIDLWLGGVKREYKMEFLPEKVRLSILIPFHIENSKLSAYYEKITLRCDGYDLPETMISMCSEFFPNTVFPAGFFADAIGNVVENACFSG